MACSADQVIKESPVVVKYGQIRWARVKASRIMRFSRRVLHTCNAADGLP